MLFSYEVQIKTSDGFVPITNEAPSEQQQDAFIAKGPSFAQKQQPGMVVTYLSLHQTEIECQG